MNGASGAVGTAAVQLAEHAGAHVTAVCSGPNRDLVTSLGADRVIDYTTEDFTAEAAGYDVIVDCVGNAPYARVGTCSGQAGRCCSSSPTCRRSCGRRSAAGAPATGSRPTP